jgi:UDP-galactopyranose mutase
MKYDWLIVGTGLAGSVFAYEQTRQGKTCLMIDRRSDIGGNVHTELRDGIHIHKWGAHIFHTDSPTIWNWITQFGEFNNYAHRVFCNWKSKLYSFPIGLKTLNELNPTITSPEQARRYFDQFKTLEGPDNLENHCLRQIGPELYETFIKEYTQKQWGKPPAELPSRIIKRIPVRTNFDTTYFNNAKYQGIPVNGYTQLIEAMTLGIKKQMNVDYLKDRQYWDEQAHRVLYTGALDEYFDWDMGELEWRSLDFEHSHIKTPDFQGTSVINYTEASVPYTRIIEHKHFTPGSTSPTTWITKEFPKEWKRGSEPYYPIADDSNNKRHRQYVERFNATGKFFAGRLADYKYYDMDQVIASSLSLSKTLLTQ